MDRRQFLEYGLRGLVVLNTLGIAEALADDSEDLTAKLTPANQQLRDFPDEIPGAGKIKKYEVSGAEYCLVHVKQMHYRPIGSQIKNMEDSIEKENEINRVKNIYIKTNKVQKDIFDIFRYLIENEGMKELFVEGMTSEMTPQELGMRYAARAVNVAFCGAFDKKFRQDYENFRYIPGAELIFKEKELKLIQGENHDLHEKAKKAEDPSIYNTPRENFLLSQVVKHDKPLAIVTYGFTHNFRNNEWNSKNKGNEFSWIEVTPQSFFN